MKKDYYVKIKKKQIRKKLRSESGRRKSPVFCAKSNSAKICISRSLEYNKGRNTKKRIQKAEIQKEL